jgi:hypothetical protein
MSDIREFDSLHDVAEEIVAESRKNGNDTYYSAYFMKGLYGKKDSWNLGILKTDDDTQLYQNQVVVSSIDNRSQHFYNSDMKGLNPTEVFIKLVTGRFNREFIEEIKDNDDISDEKSKIALSTLYEAASSYYKDRRSAVIVDFILKQDNPVEWVCINMPFVDYIETLFSTVTSAPPTAQKLKGIR